MVAGRGHRVGHGARRCRFTSARAEAGCSGTCACAAARSRAGRVHRSRRGSSVASAARWAGRRAARTRRARRGNRNSRRARQRRHRTGHCGPAGADDARRAQSADDAPAAPAHNRPARADRVSPTQDAACKHHRLRPRPGLCLARSPGRRRLPDPVLPRRPDGARTAHRRGALHVAVRVPARAR